MYQLNCSVGRNISALLMLAASLLAVRPAEAQADLSGTWGSRAIEDQYYRGGPRPRPGESVGLPLNEAGTWRAQSFDQSSNDGAP